MSRSGKKMDYVDFAETLLRRVSRVCGADVDVYSYRETQDAETDDCAQRFNQVPIVVRYSNIAQYLFVAYEDLLCFLDDE